jgi:hypothetical protein
MDGSFGNNFADTAHIKIMNVDVDLHSAYASLVRKFYLK